MLKTTISFLRAHLGRAIDQVAMRGDRIVVERHGRPVAALVRYSDYVALEQVKDTREEMVRLNYVEHMDAFIALRDALREAQRAHDGGAAAPARMGDDAPVRPRG